MEQEGHDLVTDEQLCPDMAKCRDHIAKLTPYDARLYERYSARFDARVKAFSTATNAATTTNGTTTTTNDNNSNNNDANNNDDGNDNSDNIGTQFAARLAALAPVTVPTSDDVRARTGKAEEEWYGGVPPDAKCAWLHVSTGPPAYSVDEPCGRVSTAVGRWVQAAVAGGKTVDASDSGCCTKFGEVCDGECHALRARVALDVAARAAARAATLPALDGDAEEVCDEACVLANAAMVAEGEAAMNETMSDGQRQALTRVALLAERRRSSRRRSGASSLALLASSNALEPAAAAAASQLQQGPQLLDLEVVASGGGDGEGLWRVVTPARAAELRAVRPSSLWSPRR